MKEMEKEILVQKWLSGELSPSEREAFKQLEEYEDYVKILDTAKQFKAPVFDVEKNYTHLKTQLPVKKQKEKSWKSLLRVAAVLAVLISTYFFFFYNPETQIEAEMANTEEIVLPDKSLVLLNAGSSLRFSEKNWESERAVVLEGEAFFKVEKGQQFEVKTATGNVRVLGTEFNVKQRDSYFEVSCYEGLVAVTSGNEELQLAAGESFRIINNKKESRSLNDESPTWTHGVSNFESVPYEAVLAELERQYNVKVITKNIKFDTAEPFTGSFAHTNLEAALEAVSIPFGLNYSINGDQVILE